jgi:hypothetical protein
MAKGYEVFEYVGRGNGDYGTEWARVACRPTIKGAVSFADLRREAFPDKTLRIMTAPARGVGRLVADLPGRRAA